MAIIAKSRTRLSWIITILLSLDQARAAATTVQAEDMDITPMAVIHGGIKGRLRGS